MTSSIVIGCLLVLVACLSWFGKRNASQFAARKGVTIQLSQMPEVILGRIGTATGIDANQEKLIKQGLEEWVTLHEVIQTGDPSMDIYDALDEEVRSQLLVLEDDFRSTVKVLKTTSFVQNSTSGEALLSLQQLAKPYKIGMTGVQQMLETGFSRTNSWILTAQLILVIVMISLMILESVFIDKPILDFLTRNVQRYQTLRHAESSHMKVVRDLAERKVARNSPAVGKKVVAEKEPASLLSDQYPAKVLLVEDHPANQKYVQKLFSKLGYDADIASNGREAVAKALTTSYDLIFMDIQMPIMDGIQASYEILNSLEESEAPIIIALTGSAEPEIQEQCLDIGMKDIIWKPVKKDQVTEMIVKWRTVPA